MNEGNRGEPENEGNRGEHGNEGNRRERLGMRQILYPLVW